MKQRKKEIRQRRPKINMKEREKGARDQWTFKQERNKEKKIILKKKGGGEK